MQNQSSKKVIVALALVLAVLVVGIYLISLIGKRSITITSSEGAEISVATEPNGEFERIGVTTAAYSTKEDAAVHFQVTAGTSVSRVSVLPDEADGSTINVPLIDPKTPEKLIDGPIKDPLIRGGKIYGISGATHSFISADLDEFSPLDLKYIGLPFLDSIEWQDQNNFAYESFDGRVGQFINGKDEGTTKLISGIDGDELTGNFSDMSKYSDQPIVFLGFGTIYTGSGIGRDIKSVANVDFGNENFLSSDENYIYHSTDEPPAAFATEGTGPENVAQNQEGKETLKVTVLDYSGNIVTELMLSNMHSIQDVVSLDENRFLVLGDAGLTLAGSNGSSVFRPYYLGSANNMIQVEGDIYLVDSDGLWRYEVDSGVYSLITPFVGTQSYVLGSMALEDSGSILYSATGDDLSGSTSSGAVYRITPN